MSILITKIIFTVPLLFILNSCFSAIEGEEALIVSRKRLNASIRIMSFEESSKVLEIERYLNINYKRPVDIIYCFSLKECLEYSHIDYLVFSTSKSFKGHSTIRKKYKDVYQIDIESNTEFGDLLKNHESSKLSKFEKMLDTWKGPDDIVNWLSSNVTYDIERSVYIRNTADKIKLLIKKMYRGKIIITNFFHIVHKT
jgi:hypothetical protein